MIPMIDFEVKHRAGRVHNNADALSRLRPTPELIRKLQQDAINTCSVTLNPSINIRDAQQQDASIAKQGLFNGILKLNKFADKQ